MNYRLFLYGGIKKLIVANVIQVYDSLFAVGS